MNFMDKETATEQIIKNSQKMITCFVTSTQMLETWAELNLLTLLNSMQLISHISPCSDY